MNSSILQDNSYAEAVEHFSFRMHVTLIIPELIYLLIFLLGIYGMYQGIEIQHPLYAVLFLNLLVPSTFTVVNIFAFPFISTEKYIKILNLSSALCLYFHCTSWYDFLSLAYTFWLLKSRLFYIYENKVVLRKTV
jgi:hypothetical protein